MAYAYMVVLALFLFVFVTIVAFLVKSITEFIDYVLVYIVCYVVGKGMVGNMGKEQAHSNLAYAKIRVRNILPDVEVSDVFVEHALMSVMGKHA